MKEKNPLSDVRSPEFFGKRPMIGLLIFLAGIVIFLALALNYKFNGPLIKVDVELAKSLYSVALKTPPVFVKILVGAYYVGKQGIAISAYILLMYFLFKKAWREVVMVIVTFAPLGNLFLLLSRFFNRSRPFLMFDKPIWPASPNIPGFPSGHSLSILVLCGFVAYFLVPQFNSRKGKGAVIFIALFIVFVMGFSRLFVGDHYLTDIIAGYGVGIAWLALTITLVELIFKKGSCLEDFSLLEDFG